MLILRPARIDASGDLTGVAGQMTLVAQGPGLKISGSDGLIREPYQTWRMSDAALDQTCLC